MSQLLEQNSQFQSCSRWEDKCDSILFQSCWFLQHFSLVRKVLISARSIYAWKFQYSLQIWILELMQYRLLLHEIEHIFSIWIQDHRIFIAAFLIYLHKVGRSLQSSNSPILVCRANNSKASVFPKCNIFHICVQ